MQRMLINIAFTWMRSLLCDLNPWKDKNKPWAGGLAGTLWLSRWVIKGNSYNTWPSPGNTPALLKRGKGKPQTSLRKHQINCNLITLSVSECFSLALLHCMVELYYCGVQRDEDDLHRQSPNNLCVHEIFVGNLSCSIVVHSQTRISPSSCECYLTNHRHAVFD